MQADDMTLVREFVARHSEAAFTELVRRHINLVYSTARRRLNDVPEAEEVTQAVFLILAAKAKNLRSGTVLSGWLYQTAQLTAANFQRAALRRRYREQEAYMRFAQESEPDHSWQRLSPLLEEAMMRLGKIERDAVVLRFFENRSVHEVAAALGLGEAAAQKRVNRATDKLRKFFQQRGLRVSTAALLDSIGTNAVQVAPVGLASTVITMAVAKGATVGSSTLTLIKTTMKLMTWTKIKTAAVVTVVIAAVATTTAVVHQRQSPVENASNQPAWGRDSWTNAGYQTPEATLKTMLWAMSSGDIDNFLGTYTPEEKARMEKEWRGRPRDVLSAEGKRHLGGVTGVIIVQQIVAGDHAVIRARFEGDSKTRQITLRKIGTEWKCALAITAPNAR